MLLAQLFMLLLRLSLLFLHKLNLHSMKKWIFTVTYIILMFYPNQIHLEKLEDKWSLLIMLTLYVSYSLSFLFIFLIISSFRSHLQQEFPTMAMWIVVTGAALLLLMIVIPK